MVQSKFKAGVKKTVCMGRWIIGGDREGDKIQTMSTCLPIYPQGQEGQTQHLLYTVLNEYLFFEC